MGRGTRSSLGANFKIGWTRTLAIAVPLLALAAGAPTQAGAVISPAAIPSHPATEYPRVGTVVPNAINELDCNGFSTAYGPAKASMKPLCADPIQGGPGDYYKANDNGHYIGHDEPSIKFESSAPGSGNHMTYYMQLPHDPPSAPTANGSTSIYAMLSPAPWFGMSVCDPNSDPVGPCTPDTDPPVNNPNTTGQAFMELQFYPPGFQPFQDSVSCDATKWCSALTIDSVTCPTKSAGTCVPNVNCFEPVNFAFLQTNGVPAGPPSPQLVDLQSYTPNANTLKMGPDDVLQVTLQDHISAGDDAHSGLMTSIHDVTTGQTGYMISSAANGFMSTDSTTCNGAPFSFHPTYNTASKANMLPWSVLEGGILAEQEIGHMETCASLTNAGPTGTHYSNNEVFIDSGTQQTCVGGIAENGGTGSTGEGPCVNVSLLSSCVGATTEGGAACPQNVGQGVNSCEGSDGTCIPAGTRSTLQGPATSPATITYTNPVNECQANQAQNGDLDFDGNAYITDWPDGTTNHPTSIRYVGPLDASGSIYPQVQLETDLAGSEQNCSLSSTNAAGCVVPPLGPGNKQTFYPYWSLTGTQGIKGTPVGTSSTCTWNFGNTISGVTTNDLGKDAEYGSGVSTSRGDFISNVETNPEFSGNCPLAPFSVPPPPQVFPFGTTCPGPQIVGIAGDAPDLYPGGSGQNMDNLDILHASFSTEASGGGATFIDITLAMKNLTVPPDATFDSNIDGAFWSVHWIYNGKAYEAEAGGGPRSPSTVTYTAGPDTGNEASASMNPAIAGSFNVGKYTGSGAAGTITFHVPVGDVGKPPLGAMLSNTYAVTHGTAAPPAADGGLYFTAAGDVAPDGSGNPLEPGFGADYFVGQTCLAAFAGYVDNLHLGPSGTYGGPFQPTPWQGSSNTIFVGCNRSVSGHPCTNTSLLTNKTCPTIPGSAPLACYDAGAVRIDNPSSTAAVVTQVTVVIGGCTFNPWAGEPAGRLTVPAHGHLILTQTGGLGPNVTCGFAPKPEIPYNFDTSDTLPKGRCANTGYIPSVAITTSFGTVLYQDTGRVLNHGGLDPSCTSKNANESSNWSTLMTPAGPSYTLDNAMPYGGEPSLLSDNTGELYVTSPSAGVQIYKSTNQGVNWAAFPVNPDTSSGDNCLATDQANAVYACNLAGSVDTCQLQADVWKTVNQGTSWQYGSNTTIPMPAGTSCGTSASPFGVDRDWVDAWIPTGMTSTSNAEVILMYHDFYGPSSIWINKSINGGATFGAPVNVMQHLTTANPTMNAVVAADSACNTVPSGVRIEKSGPHVGRIYVAWIAADAAQDTNGCNVSMAQSFHNLIVAWSDDNGATWTPQVAMDIGVGQDASTPFAAFTIDDRGNPYFGFDSQTPSPGTGSAPSTRATKCAAESSGSSPTTDPTCSYNMYVIWSPNGGTTWDDGKGTPAGSASIPYQASPAGQTGTDQFATIAAGNPGMVDISYVHTDEVEPQNAYGKFDPLGCDGGDNAAGTTPPNYPARCVWNLFVGQSLDLASTTAAPSTAKWTNSQATTVPMHYGDICNLGIACVQPSPANPRDPRHLLDFNLETIDPTTGCAHIAFADDNLGSTYGDPSNLDAAHGNAIVAANQTSGPNILGLTTGPCASP